jgi:hypothetical protein
MFPTAQIGHSSEIVDGSCIHRSRVSHHEKRRTSGGAIFLDCLFQLSEVDPVTIVGWN